jgi:hypothetical protein
MNPTTSNQPNEVGNVTGVMENLFGKADPSTLRESMKEVDEHVQLYIDDFNNKTPWNNAKNVKLLSSFGDLVRDLQQYEILRGTLEQQQKALKKKEQLNEAQQENIEIVERELCNILGDDYINKMRSQKMEVDNNDNCNNNDDDLKHEVTGTVSASSAPGDTGSKQQAGDNVVSLLNDLDHFREAFRKVLRWDELNKPPREASDYLNTEMKKYIESIDKNIDSLKQVDISREDQYKKLADLKAKDLKVSQELHEKINEAEILSRKLSDARQNIYKRHIKYDE